jgi:beta-1,2-N-acetylglucosaminyltransferase
MFDTYMPGAAETLGAFVQQLGAGRIVLAAVKDEASYSLTSPARMILAQVLGSRRIGDLGWRDTFVLAAQVGGEALPPVLLAEDTAHNPDSAGWAASVSVQVDVQLTPPRENICRHWPDTAVSRQRQAFCQKYDGYGDLCACTPANPSLLLRDRPRTAKSDRY